MSRACLVSASACAFVLVLASEFAAASATLSRPHGGGNSGAEPDTAKQPVQPRMFLVSETELAALSQNLRDDRIEIVMEELQKLRESNARISGAHDELRESNARLDRELQKVKAACGQRPENDVVGQRSQPRRDRTRRQHGCEALSVGAIGAAAAARRAAPAACRRA